MSENKIKDERFQFLVDMGFEISEINTDSDFYSTIMNERLNVA